MLLQVQYACARKRAKYATRAKHISFYFPPDDKLPRRRTLPLPYEFLQEQSNDEWNNATSQANTSQPDKKASPMTTGGHRWPGERSLGYAPQRKPVIEGIAIRGKIKCPFLFSPHLIIHARLAKPCRYKKGRKKPGLFVSATRATLIAYWPSLLTTWRPRKQIPLAAVHLSGEEECFDGGELWDGWRMKKNVSVKSSAPREKRKSRKTRQTNKEVDLFYFLLKKPRPCAIIQLCHVPIHTQSLFFPHG